MDKKTTLIILLLAVFLFGGAFWLGMKNQSMAPQLSSTQSGNKEVTDETLTYAQQLKLKASWEMLGFWEIRNVFQSPKNPQVFYFILNEQKEARIVKYDTSKVDNYLQNESIDFPAYMENVLVEALPVGLELRGVGFDGDKFVFTKTSTENSPGPCFSPWFYKDLSYVEINTTSAVRKSYAVSSQRLVELKEEERLCREAL